MESHQSPLPICPDTDSKFAVRPVEAVFDRLRAHFDLTVVTLNYDGIIDRTGDWYDGFGDAGSGTSKFGSFDTPDSDGSRCCAPRFFCASTAVCALGLYRTERPEIS
jgi:hypothetical protein